MYWQYYVDDALKPWLLNARNIDAEVDFSYHANKLTAKGECTIEDGVLQYGDFSIKGDAKMTQELKYVKDSPDENVVKINLSTDKTSFLFGKSLFLDKGSCTAHITKDEIIIEKLAGIMGRVPVNLSGKFSAREPKQLIASGTVFDINNDFHMKFLPNEQAEADWNASIKDSFIKAHMDLSNIKNLAFDLNIDGHILLENLSKVPAIKRGDFKGKLSLAGNIKGEMDKANSLEGSMDLKVEDLSVLNFQPASFNFKMILKDGLFKGAVPKIEYYNGQLSGEVIASLNKWGLGLDIDKFDLEQFSKSDPQLAGMKGLLTINTVCVSSWHDINSIKGGGYFNGRKCDVQNVPIFSDAEEGMKSLSKDFTMPVLDSVEGNFSAGDKNINFENISCKAKGMNLNINGKVSFSGDVDATAGIKIFNENIFRIARQIIIPYTIAFDMLVNSVRINIYGKWPNLQQAAKVEPIGWLNDFFEMTSPPQPNKYTLEYFFL